MRAFLPILAFGLLMSGQALANGDSYQPRSLKDLQKISLKEKEEDREVELLKSNNLRVDAMREAAMSYGARGGLAMQTWRIRKALETKQAYMDRIYDFNRLLIAAPSGFLIEPPIVTEALDAMIIQDGGQSAAVADRVLEVNQNAKIVSTARNWRSYLERDWGGVEEPPVVLRPVRCAEKREWASLVAEGWRQGESQANDIFQADLARLNGDFTGMVRYRMLLAQGLISAPFALQMDRGVTGDGREMVIGDRAVQITGPSLLQTEPSLWRPADR